MSTVGATNLRDGQWHHIAVIFVPRNNAKQHWQVRQYVDGRLEGSGLRALKGARIEETAAPADDVVWLGRTAGKSTSDRGTFRGDIDELFIADRALPPQIIDELMSENKLAAPPEGD